MVVPELREVELGDWEGGEFRRRLEQQDPMILTLMREGSWDYVPNGEGDEAFTARVRAGLRRSWRRTRGSGSPWCATAA